MSKDEALKLADERAAEYNVAGYGRSDDGYGGPYHPDAFKSPHVEFALAGDPEAQEAYQKDLAKLDEAHAKKNDGNIDKVDLVASSSHSTVVETQPYRAAAEEATAPATAENVAKAEKRTDVHPAKAPERRTVKKAAAKKAASPKGK